LQVETGVELADKLSNRLGPEIQRRDVPTYARRNGKEAVESAGVRCAVKQQNISANKGLEEVP
jgi:hypothetical protein